MAVSDPNANDVDTSFALGIAKEILAAYQVVKDGRDAAIAQVTDLTSKVAALRAQVISLGGQPVADTVPPPSPVQLAASQPAAAVAPVADTTAQPSLLSSAVSAVKGLFTS